MKNYKICILANSLNAGGGERVAAVLYDDFKRCGMEVDLGCLEKNNFYSVSGDVHYLSEADGKKEGSVKKFFALYRLAVRLKRYVRENDIHCVQSHIYRANYVNVLGRLIGSGHVCQIVNHGIASRYRSGGILGRVNLFLIRLLYGRADQLICPSNGMLEDLQSLGRMPEDSRVINNPLQVDNIVQSIANSGNGSECEINYKYIIAVGRLEEVKRIEDIILSFQRIVDEYKTNKLVIVGDGPERSSLKALVAQLELSDRVVFVGQVANPFGYIANADLLLSASKFEGFSYVVAEALLCGTAVISSDCLSGPREILAPGTQRIAIPTGRFEVGEYGILVNVGDIEGMASAMRHVLSNPEIRKRMEHTGRMRGMDFSINKIAQKYKDSIAEAVAKRNG